MFSMKLDTSEMERKLKELEKKSPEALRKALEIAAIQFLTWSANGSSKESRKPPIRRGFLRGSGSAFVGSKLVGLVRGHDNKEANRSYSDNPLNVTWGYNSEYATKMHETNYKPGPFSAQDGDAGNKWLERHLSADRELFMKVVAIEFSKELGTK